MDTQTAALGVMALVGLVGLWPTHDMKEEEWSSPEYRARARLNRKAWLNWGRWWLLFWWAPSLLTLWIKGVFG